MLPGGPTFAAIQGETSPWFWVLVGLDLLWVVVLSGYILLEKRSPMSTLAWMLGLTFLPGLGLFAWYVIGPRRFERKKLKLSRARAKLAPVLNPLENVLPSDLTALGQVSLLASKLGAPPTAAVQDLVLYPDGDSCFDALVQAIGQARRHVHAEYYIFRGDQAGTRIRDALVERAKAGVKVRLLLDAVGCPRSIWSFLSPLREAGGKVVLFNPLLFQLARRIYTFRTHRKIVVIDGEVGFTGGVNVCDDHSARVNGPRAWRDTHLRIDGAAVHGLQRAFLENWYFAARAVDRLALPPSRETHSEWFPPAKVGVRSAQIIASGPDSETRAIVAFYFAAINGARERVWLTTPYFVPEEQLLFALMSAALRGVDVQLMLPARTDALLVDAASATFQDQLLEAGVRIHIYGPEMIHAKTGVFDKGLSIVGTANLDARSLRLNFEVIAAVYDEAFNAQLAGLFARDRGHARERLATDPRLSLARRLFQSAARLLAPQL